MFESFSAGSAASVACARVGMIPRLLGGGGWGLHMLQSSQGDGEPRIPSTVSVSLLECQNALVVRSNHGACSCG